MNTSTLPADPSRDATDRFWIFCLGPAMAMLLGWGLRGFIGGGPLGAMIPGAMVALMFCLLLKLDDQVAALLTAIGAIGIGLGGQMTYGQTIGLAVRPETFAWGLLGLTLKGGVWGLSGAALLGLGFVHRQIPRRDFVIGLILLLLGLVVGWQLINVPRLIYFSDPHDKPRAEIWAGVLFGTLALLGWLATKCRIASATLPNRSSGQHNPLTQPSATLPMNPVVGQASCLSSGAGEMDASPDRRDARSHSEATARFRGSKRDLDRRILSPSDGERDGVRGQSPAISINPFQIVLRFALWGALGGAIGFGGGGLWMVAGKALPELKHWASWWKFMEFTFGFCFGLTLGIAAWLHRAAIRLAQTTAPATPPRPLPAALVIVVTLLISLTVLWCEASVDVVCAFTFLGVALLVLCRFAEPFAWQVGLTLTIAAFVYDLVEKFHEGPGWVGPNLKWLAAAVAIAGVTGILIHRLQRNQPMVRWSFLALTWAAVVVSYLKSLRELPLAGSEVIVQLIFTLSAVWVTWLVVTKWPPRAIPPTAATTG